MIKDHDGTPKMPAINYIVAVILVGAAIAILFALAPYLDNKSRFLFFVPAVLVASGIGGLGPGLVATLLSLIAVFFLVPEHANWSSGDIIGAVAFTIIGVGSALAGRYFYDARGKAAINAATARAREAHLQSIL